MGAIMWHQAAAASSGSRHLLGHHGQPGIEPGLEVPDCLHQLDAAVGGPHTGIRLEGLDEARHACNQSSQNRSGWGRSGEGRCMLPARQQWIARTAPLPRPAPGS